MTSLTVATLLQASILAASPETYAVAHQETVKTGKPLVVMISTDWCAPCRQMKRDVIPKIRKDSVFSKVTFANVNPDKEGRLAKKLTGGSSTIPQIIMYRETEDGWKRRRLVGFQSVATVKKFLASGIATAKSRTDRPMKTTLTKVSK